MSGLDRSYSVHVPQRAERVDVNGTPPAAMPPGFWSFGHEHEPSNASAEQPGRSDRSVHCGDADRPDPHMRWSSKHMLSVPTGVTSEQCPVGLSCLSLAAPRARLDYLVLSSNKRAFTVRTGDAPERSAKPEAKRLDHPDLHQHHGEQVETGQAFGDSQCTPVCVGS